MKDHEKRNGYDRPQGPGGVQLLESNDDLGHAFERERIALHGTALDVVLELQKKERNGGDVEAVK